MLDAASAVRGGKNDQEEAKLFFLAAVFVQAFGLN
jgi:hypothetical protein